MNGEQHPQPQSQPTQPPAAQPPATQPPATQPMVIPLDAVDQDFLLRKQAFRHANQGRPEAAIALFDILIQRQPNNASHYNNRGLLHFQTGEYLDALDDYDRAIALNPILSQVYNNRANCHAALGSLDEAVADYDTALDLNPTDINAWINQGVTFRDLDLYSRAVESFDIALQLTDLTRQEHPTDENKFLIGHIYTQRGRTHHVAGYWNWAIADYRRALRRLPQQNSPKVLKFYRLRAQIRNWLQELLGSEADWGCAG